MTFLLLCLSISLLCKVVFSHHDGGHEDDYGKGKHDSHHHVHGNEIVPSNSQFAFRLFKQVNSAKPLENSLFSTVAIPTAFGMLSEVARSKTHDEILNGIGSKNSETAKDDYNAWFRVIFNVLSPLDSELQLNRGNARFINKNVKTLQPFLDRVKRHSESEAFSSDTNSDEAKEQINSYMNKNTNGKIPELLSSIDKDTISLLDNWIFFRGKWEMPFNEEFTSEGDFHVDENTVVTVPFMRRTGMYNVLLSENVTVVEIPYKGNASALFILPKEGKLRHIEQNLQESTIKTWKSKLESQYVELSLPTFSLSLALDLIETFDKLGITKVFSDAADLPGITEQAKLKGSKVVHKAYLSVSEKGTEASAVTALEIMPVSLPSSIVIK
ncbi:alpha-1-antitrypsin-like [Pelobates fuscus]|uniref:alpha-1-antitrypsin-like n=1 Tax=Pelobates fuscus TaxID=191477 RepID=UPI002FE4ABFF